MFPPEATERPHDSPPRKTQRDAHKVVAHGHKAEEAWLVARRNEVWANNTFARTAASNRLANIHAQKVQATPTLKDPKRDQSEIAACLEERAEAKKGSTEFKVFGRPKSEEV